MRIKRPHSKEPSPSLTAKTYFGTLRALNDAALRDQSLTPSALLLFRVLAELANNARWPDTFVATLDALQGLTHLSRHTLIAARRCLKSKGYIDFSGKPSRYSVHSAVHSPPHQSASPTPPINT